MIQARIWWAAAIITNALFALLSHDGMSWVNALLAVLVAGLWICLDPALLPFRQFLARHTFCRSGCSKLREIRHKVLSSRLHSHPLLKVDALVERHELLAQCPRCGRVQQLEIQHIRPLE